jgi:hypothetical protein
MSVEPAECISAVARDRRRSSKPVRALSDRTGIAGGFRVRAPDGFAPAWNGDRVDTLLRGGRVIDPGTDTDRIADLLISDGRVAAVGTDLVAPADAAVIDVEGLIVGPGFVEYLDVARLAAAAGAPRTRSRPC